MNGFDSQRQDQYSRKRRWQEKRPSLPNYINNTTTGLGCTAGSVVPSSFIANPKSFPGISSFDVDDDLVSAVVPPVTVVLEGRSICQRISLHKHASYQSLAKAFRQMFVDDACTSESTTTNHDHHLDLSNAIPGHLIAYEDMENDLLLVGDLNWKDFVRVAKRIRILPVKGNSRKWRRGA